MSVWSLLEIRDIHQKVLTSAYHLHILALCCRLRLIPMKVKQLCSVWCLWDKLQSLVWRLADSLIFVPCHHNQEPQLPCHLFNYLVWRDYDSLIKNRDWISKWLLFTQGVDVACSISNKLDMLPCYSREIEIRLFCLPTQKLCLLMSSVDVSSNDLEYVRRV